MKNIAIIPARGGSKRIPRKNIKIFEGFPIIKYSIDAARNACCFEEIMVSTDDHEIASIAEDFGARVPFIRSQISSSDNATLADVVIEVLDYYHKCENDFDAFCCILPTVPLLRSERILQALDIFIDTGADSVFPVVRFGYPIQRGLRIQKGFVEMLWPENYDKRSQDFETIYHDSGQFYWSRTRQFLKEKRFFMTRTAAIELPEHEVQDIDTLQDWRIAEIKYTLRRKNSDGEL